MTKHVFLTAKDVIGCNFSPRDMRAAQVKAKIMLLRKKSHQIIFHNCSATVRRSHSWIMFSTTETGQLCTSFYTHSTQTNIIQCVSMCVLASFVLAAF